MGILVITLSINSQPLSALELKVSGLIMESSRVDTAGDNQNAKVINSNYRILRPLFPAISSSFRSQSPDKLASSNRVYRHIRQVQ